MYRKNLTRRVDDPVSCGMKVPAKVTKVRRTGNTGYFGLGKVVTWILDGKYWTSLCHILPVLKTQSLIKYSDVKLKTISFHTITLFKTYVHNVLSNNTLLLNNF